jgi:hypothetical protein
MSRAKKGVGSGTTYIVLVILSAFLIFGGPTYLLLVLNSLEISYPVLVFLGLTSFITGVILFTRYIHKETI